MVNKIVLAALLAMAGLLGFLDRHDAFACNRTAGCVMDSLEEDYDMMRDGRMDKAIKAGRDNVEAFRALQAKQQAYSAKK